MIKRKVFIVGVVSILVITLILFCVLNRDTNKELDCNILSEKLLKIKNSKYSFNRCTEEVYKVTNTDESLTRIYVVAGDVEPQWEFECGFMAQCSTFNGWFNDKGEYIDFVDKPIFLQNDPSIYTIGCEEPNSKSTADVQVQANIIIQDGRYWWKIEYHNIKSRLNCLINGTSLISRNEVISNISAKYPEYDPKYHPECDSPYPMCKLRDAIFNNSVEYCMDDKGYDSICVEYFILQTGDQSLCGTKTNSFGNEEIVNCKDFEFKISKKE